MPELVDVAPDAIYVMVTNPVDIVTYAALQDLRAAEPQVFGSRHGAGLLAAALPPRRAHRRRRPEHPRVHRGRARRQRDPAVELGDDRVGAADQLAGCCGPGREMVGRLTAEDRERIAARGGELRLPDHRGQGRDELRGRARRLADHRGGPRRRGPGSAGVHPARRLLRHRRRLPLRAVGRRSEGRADTAGGPDVRRRADGPSALGRRRCARSARQLWAL